MSFSSHKKTLLFGEIEDVISVNALLRPTIVRAVRELSINELRGFRECLVRAERELANSRLEFRERFQRAQKNLREAYEYGPVWRFIAGRIEECWSTAPVLTVKELSAVSLFFGTLLEETQARLQEKARKIA